MVTANPVSPGILLIFLKEIARSLSQEFMTAIIPSLICSYGSPGNSLPALSLKRFRYISQISSKSS